jgi:ATP-dependent helicase HrpA
MIRDGYDTLHILGAVTEGQGGGVGGELTPLGRELAKLPIDPTVGRMLLGGRDEHCLRELLVIAAVLEIQDPRERPMDRADAADEAHEKFKDEQSDFVALLNLWRFYTGLDDKLSHSKIRAACQTNFLSAVRMREWKDVHRQLQELVLEMGMRLNDRPAEYDALHRAILTGLLSNIGRRGSDNFEYTGTRGTKFNIFPGSGLFKKGPQWVVAAELVRTTKLYARTVAKIQPEWIEGLAPHLCKRTYSEPVWSKELAHVRAFEKVQVLGLDVVPRRPVHYGPIDPPTSREMFIHHGLVEAEYASQGQFQKHNAAMLEQARSMEAKARRPSLIADAKKRFDFYDKRVPQGVFSGPTFEGWRRQAERDQPKLLYMSLADVLSGDPGTLTTEAVPDRVAMGRVELPLVYKFEPGKEQDGITLTVPLGALTHVSPVRCQWLVPAWLEDLITALAKALPKQYRQRLKSVNEFAKRASEKFAGETSSAAGAARSHASGESEANLAAGFGAGSLAEALSAEFKAETGLDLPPSAWPFKGIPDHLKMNLRVIDERGAEVMQSRDVDDVKKRLAARAARSFATMARSDLDRDGLTSFDLPDLPESVLVGPRGAQIPAYPALLERDDAEDVGKEGGKPGPITVSLRLVDSPELAAKLSRHGLVRLYLHQAEKELRHTLKLLPDLSTMAMHYAPIGPGEEFQSDLVRLIAERTFLGDDGGAALRTKAEFVRRLDAGWNVMPRVGQEVGKAVSEILAARQRLTTKLAGQAPAAWKPVFDDVKRQLAGLMPRRFIARTPWPWLRHYPRFLSAIEVRLSRLAGSGLSRDLASMQELVPLVEIYRQREAALDGAEMPPMLDQLRWMLEELRVSLFAQELRTSITVSVKRVSEHVQRMALHDPMA